MGLADRPTSHPQRLRYAKIAAKLVLRSDVADPVNDVAQIRIC